MKNKTWISKDGKTISNIPRSKTIKSDKQGFNIEADGTITAGKSKIDKKNNPNSYTALIGCYLLKAGIVGKEKEEIKNKVFEMLTEYGEQKYQEGQKDAIVQYEERPDVCGRDIEIFETTRNDIKKEAIQDYKQELIKWLEKYKNKYGENIVALDVSIDDLITKLKNK